MTKALWEHRDVLEKVHSQGKNITLETALDGIGIPLHPGAELYYKEVGEVNRVLCKINIYMAPEINLCKRRKKYFLLHQD